MPSTVLPGGSLHINLAQTPVNTTRFFATPAAQTICNRYDGYQLAQTICRDYDCYQLALCHGVPASDEVCSLVDAYLCPQEDTYRVVIPAPATATVEKKK